MMRLTLLFFLFVLFTASAGDFKLIYEGDKVGLADDSGNVILPARYEALGWSDGRMEPLDQVIGYKKDGLWGLVSLADEIITAHQFSSLYPASQAYVIAARRGKFSHSEFVGLIALDGRIVLPCDFSTVVVANNYAIVSRKSGRHYEYGVRSLNGEERLKTIYKDIVPVGNQLLLVKDFDDKQGIFSDQGKALTDWNITSVEQVDNEHVIIMNDYKKGLLHQNGELLAGVNYADIRLTNGAIEVKPFDMWQIFAGTMEKGQLSYTDVEPGMKDGFLVSANGHQWLSTLSDSALSSVRNQAYITYEEVAFFKHGQRWGVQRADKEILPARYDELRYENDRILAKAQDKWMIFDEYGVEKTAQRYEAIRALTPRTFSVMKNGKWGVVDRFGEEIWHCVFEQITGVYDDKLVVRFHGEYGIVSLGGAWVVTPQPHPITIINEQMYLITEPGLTKMMHVDNGTIYFTSNKLMHHEGYFLEELENGVLWKISYTGQIDNRNYQPATAERTYSEGMLAVKMDQRYGFIDRAGRLIIANRYENAADFSGGLVAIQLLGKWGYIDKNEKLVIQPNYVVAGDFSNELAIVGNGSGYGVINRLGQKVSSFNYNRIERLANGYFKTSTGGKVGLLDDEGQLLVNARYDELELLPDGTFRVSLFGKYGILSGNGADLLPVMYDQITYDHHNGYYLALKKSDWEKLQD